MKVSEIVREAVSLAKAANEARAAQGQEDSPIVASGSYTATVKPRITEERRLREFLEKQSSATIYLLLAITNLGRGDFEAKDLLEQYRDMDEAYGDAQLAARQIFEMWPLPEFLEKGMAELDRAGLDIDTLMRS
ncbi:MAG: DUF3775 domain-containing protein [Gemmataceae bacterium]|nr:DUF3775 domain-containing protein [Gemmataceae bacterium]